MRDRQDPSWVEKSAAGERISYSFSPHVADVLEELGATLAVTTYQAGRVLFVRARDGRLNLLMRQFEKPMGMAIQGRALALGTRRQIWRFDRWREERRGASTHSESAEVYTPRRSWVTGDVAVHEVAWIGDTGDADLCFVATRFSCLAVLDETCSFRPIWKPSFVSALRPEDRCHLNGLAIRDGAPSVVTVLGATDTPQGWREHKATGGALIDVASGELMTHGLSMPHSPRWWGERLLVLDSGRGELQIVDRASGEREAIARMPGFSRGLAMAGNIAFVGLSKIREKREFGGLPIEGMRDRLECGVHLIDLTTGRPLGQIRFDSGAHELFDVQLIDTPWPSILGFEKDDIDHTFRLRGESP